MKLMIFGDAGSIHLKKWVSPFVEKYSVYLVSISNTRHLVEGVHKQIRLPVLGNMALSVFLYSPIVFILSLIIKPNILHAHYASSYGLLGLFVLCKHKVLSAWGSDINDTKRSSLRRFLMKIILSKYTKINASSIMLKKEILNMCVMSNVYDFQYGVEIDKLPLIKEISSEKDISFVSNRGFSSIYHISDLITGFDYYKSCGGEGELHIYGFGSSEDVECIKNESLLSKNGSVHFHGFLEHDSLMEKMVDYNVYISIPEQDGAPLSLFEAMYIGLFPLLSDIPINNEISKQASCSIVSNYSKESIAEALFESEKKCRSGSYINMNRKYVEINHDYTNNIKIMEGLYKLNSE